MMKFFVVFCVVFANANAWVMSPGLATNFIDYMKSNYSLQLIFPGTKWCGAGDVADNYDDLGTFWDVDMCCRAHDNCDDSITAGATSHGLVNDAPFTKSHCKCDLGFYACLQSSECTEIATAIGVVYFDWWGPQCFDLRAPAKCIKLADGIWERCLEYSYDDTKPAEWQWFDSPTWQF